MDDTESTDNGGAPERFEIGDRVVAVTDLGMRRRPRVKRSAHGVIAGRTPWGELEVHFGDRVEPLAGDKICPE